MNPEKYDSEVDQVVHDAFNYYRTTKDIYGRPEWQDAFNIMHEAASRNPGRYGPQLEQAAYEAFNHYKMTEDKSGSLQWNEGLRIMRVAASSNPYKYNSELDQATCEAFNYYKERRMWWDALCAVREVAERNPDVFGPMLQQAQIECLFCNDSY